MKGFKMYIDFKNITEVISNLLSFMFKSLLLVVGSMIRHVIITFVVILTILLVYKIYSNINSLENESSPRTVKCVITIVGDGEVKITDKKVDVSGLSSFEIQVERYSTFEMEWESSNNKSMKINLHFDGLTGDREFTSKSGNVSFQTEGGCFIHSIKTNLGGNIFVRRFRKKS